MAFSKSIPVYFAMDRTVNTTTDTNIYNNIKNKLIKAGINVVTSATYVKGQGGGVNPSAMYQNMVYVYNKGFKKSDNTNVIMFHLMNGVDPSNIREVSPYKLSDGSKGAGNDNRGNTVRTRGNDVILGWFYGACDFYHEEGACYKQVRGSETGGAMDYPRKVMDDNGIKYVYSKEDKTGDKIAEQVIALFEDSTTPTPTPTPTEISKTLKTRLITEIYSVPYYEKVLTAKTDENGNFSYKLPKDMIYNGLYKVNVYFDGDSDYEKSSNTHYIQKFNGQVFQEKLLYKSIIDTYSDGTVTKTYETGSIPTDKDIKTVTTTNTYISGTLQSSTTKTVEERKVIEHNTDNQDFINTTETINTSPTTTSKASPFSNVVAPLNDGTPNVSLMTHSNKPFEMVDLNTTYTFTLDQYRGAFWRDSKILQINNYYDTKYVAVESSDKYIVFDRMRWNSIEASVYKWHLGHNGKAWPEKMEVDMKNHKTRLDGSDWISWNREKSYYHVIGDRQQSSANCGATSASMCSQYLHYYISEKKMTNTVGEWVAPDRIINKGLKLYNMTGEVISSKDAAINWLKERKPVIWHIQSHYLVWWALNTTTNNVLVGNSAGGSGSYAPWTGWRSVGYFVGSKDYGQKIKVELNWNISENEKQQLKNYITSMCGNFVIPDNSEAVPNVYSDTWDPKYY